MSAELRLRRLSLGDEQAFLEAQRVMEPEGFEFGMHYEPGMLWSDYLALLSGREAGRQLPPGRVPDTTLVGDVHGDLVGRISIRHDLNAWLAEVGGHIGYCVLPAFRGRGHATEMLRQSLSIAWGLGIPNVLITCDEDNIGSRKVIEANGGAFERHAVNPDGPLKRRYWVPTSSLGG